MDSKVAMDEMTEAIAHDSIAKLLSLIKAGADLNKPLLVGTEYDLEAYDEISPLFYAIKYHASLEMIEMMLSHGVDLCQTDPDGIGVLDMAIKFKRKDVIQLCIDKGFDLNATKRKSGMTPVILAACFSDTEMMQLLLDAGGDIQVADNTGMKPLDYAKKLGQKKMQAYLEAYGVASL